MRTFWWSMVSLLVGLTVIILLLARWAFGYVAALPLVGLIIYACFAPHSEAVRAEWMIAGVFGGAFALGLGSEIFRGLGAWKGTAEPTVRDWGLDLLRHRGPDEARSTGLDIPGRTRGRVSQSLTRN